MHRKAEDKYNTTEKGKARNARYKLSEKGRAVHAKSVAKYLQSDKGRITRKAYDARYHANMNERAWAIIGKTCAWAELGGCSELMAKDHIVPVKRRHKSGYSSFGYALTRWIVDNPAEAKKKVQCLCEVHNWFKNDMPDDEARAKWAARHPLTQEMFEEIVEDVA
ncbi:hypothetical protein FBQ96_00810 [Nitrospirales bacterium NOB]|nr:hypothetical protein [Nitrospirales bacterium NOB]